jgi:hypothetical protein
LLETALAEHDTSLTPFLHLPQFDPVRKDHRFIGILRRMNLRALD